MKSSAACTIDFHKLNSAGNDFICIDNSCGRFTEIIGAGQVGEFVRRICRRGLGVGADGVILACEKGTGSGVDIVARFLEPDGSEARLCGNGTACFTYWLVDTGLLAGPEINILTGAGTATGRIQPEDPRRVRVCVPNPRNMEWGIQLELAEGEWVVDFLDTGVPHVVVPVEGRLDRIDVDRLGPEIRWHERFAPEGANANFVEILDVGKIAVRTYEFGVEAETLACGTGSAAAAIVSALRQRWGQEYMSHQKPVEVTVKSGAKLLVWFDFSTDGSVVDVCLETRVAPVYQAVLDSSFIPLSATDSAPVAAEPPPNA